VKQISEVKEKPFTSSLSIYPAALYRKGCMRAFFPDELTVDILFEDDVTVILLFVV
jgi:hypothetical protein